MLRSLFASFSLSLSVYEYGNVRSRVLSLSQWKASSFLYKKRALSRTEQQEQRKQKTPLLFRSSSFTAVTMPFRKGVSTARVKANKRMGLSVKRFPFFFFLLPFFLSINWAVFLRVSLLEWFTAARGDSYYVLLRFKRVGLRFSSALQSYKKFCASLSLSHSHSFYYSVGPLLAPTLFFSRIYFFVFYVSLLRGVLFDRLLFVS